jgi:hypothetical protein
VATVGYLTSRGRRPHGPGQDLVEALQGTFQAEAFADFEGWSIASCVAAAIGQLTTWNAGAWTRSRAQALRSLLVVAWGKAPSTGSVVLDAVRAGSTLLMSGVWVSS